MASRARRLEKVWAQSGHKTKRKTLCAKAWHRIPPQTPPKLLISIHILAYVPLTGGGRFAIFATRSGQRFYRIPERRGPEGLGPLNPSVQQGSFPEPPSKFSPAISNLNRNCLSLRREREMLSSSGAFARSAGGGAASLHAGISKHIPSATAAVLSGSPVDCIRAGGQQSRCGTVTG